MLKINKSQIIYARNRKALDNARASEKNEPPASGNNPLRAGQGSIKNEPPASGYNSLRAGQGSIKSVVY